MAEKKEDLTCPFHKDLECDLRKVAKSFNTMLVLIVITAFLAGVNTFTNIISVFGIGG